MNSRWKLNIKSGMTLAEVLITLLIIGIVAAITIPALLNYTKDLEYKTAYKKAYSEASSVWQTMNSNSEITNRTGRYVSAEGLADFTVFEGYFKVMTDCGTHISNCWDMSGEKFGGQPASSWYGNSFIDNSGRTWLNIPSGSFGEIILVDTNGFKFPNQFGKDRFIFWPVLQDCKLIKNISTYNDYCLGAGTPTMLLPPGDSTVTTWGCAKPPCYSGSWLSN